MEIVVLDGYTLNPGDLSWKGLEQLGQVHVYDRTAAADIVQRAAAADIVFTNKTPLTAETLAQLPKLKFIGVLATGYNIVDTASARERGIPVANIPAYGTDSVAQFVFALLLELCHRVQVHSDSVFAGEWVNSPDFSYSKAPLIELAGKTFGLIGAGRIGLRTARIAMAFGMNVVTVDRGKKPELEGIGLVDLETLLRTSDVVSLHCPLTTESERLIRADRLRLMKPTAMLINTSRGPLIDEADLAEALRTGQIAGAALDVLSVEPPRPDNPLFHAPNCIITPHIAWASQEARARLMGMAVENVRSFLAGQPQNIVNGPI